MKNTSLLLLITCTLAACLKSNLEEDVKQIEPIVDVREVFWDTSHVDLKSLPVDLGGSHTAHPINDNNESGLGYYMYKPSNYEDHDLNYPLLIFLHGSGQRGNSGEIAETLRKVLDHGPPRLVEGNLWSPKFPCLLISPQTEGAWEATGIHRFIEFVIAKYRVNPNRIYLTGLSMGAHGAWSYISNYGSRSLVTAVIPVCGAGNPSTVENLIDIPIWAFHGSDDTVVKAFTNGGSVQMANTINAYQSKFEAKVTIFPDVGHDSWVPTYDGSGMGKESSDYSPFDISIYDWMFQYRSR